MIIPVLGRLIGGRRLWRQAEAARETMRFREAAVLFEKYLQLAPADAIAHIQAGHMFKETGNFDRAEFHYDCALKLTPNDAELALQMGHFYKVVGRPQESERAYRRALELAPDWHEPLVELSQIYGSGWRNLSRSGDPAERSAGNDGGQEDDQAPWIRAGIEGLLLPDLTPQPKESMLRGYREEVKVIRLGHLERTSWGVVHVVHGVEAIRGYCISAVPIRELRVTIDKLCVYTGVPQGHRLRYERFDSNKRKYTFNIWLDFSSFRHGVYDAEVKLVDEDERQHVHTRRIVVEAPLNEKDYPNSDRLVELTNNDGRSLEDQINSRPSTVRPARRAFFTTPPRSVLIQRIDQLGDIVVSAPALRRLRELLPDSRLVGLVSPANATLVKGLGVFDDIVTADFRDDDWLQRRVMPLEQQYELQQKLQAFKFDVAIDLTESTGTRPLLLLSGARLLFGFRDQNAPWLSADYSVFSHDPRNGLEQIPPSVKLLGFVEWFGQLLRGHAEIIRRDDLSRDKLAPYGLSQTERYAVLHTGARLKFSRWPHYGVLAAKILAETDLKVVMMSDDPLPRSQLPPEIAQSDRLQILDRPLPFDDFDALLSFCAVFVGNDTGPGHLASLRGANVITMYCVRHNWNEWGHENNGYIISRRVPCAGCTIHHEPEECGKDFACVTNIRPDEVFRTVQKFLEPSPSS